METKSMTEIVHNVGQDRLIIEIANRNKDLSIGQLEKIPDLEFVTITGKPGQIPKKTATRIRTQIMRDYIRKQTEEAFTGVSSEIKASAVPELPSRYAGKFKLKTWTHKAKTRTVNSQHTQYKPEDVIRKEIPAPCHEISKEGHNSQESGFANYGALGWISSPVSGGSIDPFDSLAVEIGPRSQKLLAHYHYTYRMNSIAINPTGSFFSHARQDPAILHSILYLVSLHFNLKYNLTVSRESLYHGSEVFGIINKRLADGVFTDMTIAAVAMIVTKEIHMRGLQHMVKCRGGVESLQTIFQRIVYWSDFCFSAVWDCKPIFPRDNLIPTVPIPVYDFNNRTTLLSVESTFGVFCPMVSIIHLLRTLSEALSSTDRITASHQIYDLEFQLLSLNDCKISNLQMFTHMSLIVPLKIAAHLYLYLVIREIPPTSELIFRMVTRLQSTLQMIPKSWWSFASDGYTWLLWILFVGASTAQRGSLQRSWFVKEIAQLCLEQGIWGLDDVRAPLKNVVWRDEWCESHCTLLWAEIEAQETYKL